MKRYRKRTAKPGQLLVYYGSAGTGDPPEVCMAWGGREGNLVSTKSDSMFLHWKMFSSETIKELDERGFDITTLKFSIMMKPEQ